MTDPTPFLRFDTEAHWLAAAEVAGFLAEDGTLQAYSHDHAIDVVGIITRGGSYDPETGEVIEPPEELPGWHINFSGELPADWVQYCVAPKHPSRIFAGGGGGVTVAEPEPVEVIDVAVITRARDDQGRFIPDDPATPENEAWVEVG